MKPLKITETVLRDSHQSLIATRMTTDERWMKSVTIPSKHGAAQPLIPASASLTRIRGTGFVLSAKM